MDGIHPTHHTALGYRPIRTGTDKEVKTNTGRQRVNILGAVEVKTQDCLYGACRKEKPMSYTTFERVRMNL